MHNHNKAQQSKNRAHTSWDILYTPTNTRERNTPRAHLLICTDGHTQHALKYRCAYTYMCIWSIKKQKKIHTHTKEITQICTNTQIYAYPYTHIYIQPFMCDGVYIKLNIPDPHTQWHCPGINPIIQCNVPGPVRNQSDANSVGSVPDRSRFSMTLQRRSLLSPIRFDRLLNQEVHRQQINTDLNNGACHRLVSHYSSQSWLRCFVNQFSDRPGCPKYIVIHMQIRNNHIR